jgi:hypothetical protein
MEEIISQYVADVHINKQGSLIGTCLVCNAMECGKKHHCFVERNVNLEDYLVFDAGIEENVIFSDYKMCYDYIQRFKKAKEKGVICTLTFKRYKQLRKTTKCFYSGVKITQLNFSLDQVIPGKGYTDTNTVVCDNLLNSKKGNLSVEEIVFLYKGMKKKKLI